MESISGVSERVRVSWLWVFVALFSAAHMGLSNESHAESPVPFVPETFTVPARFETDRYRLRMLTVNDVVKDYDAVMSSAEHIQQLRPGGVWPTGLTLEQNLIDLGWHQKEFQNRSSFAFTVVELDEARVIGCIYINPTRKVGYDAEIHLWTRPPEQLSYLNESRLRATVKQWLAKAWPFSAPVFPGADISWEKWEALAETAR